MNRKKAIAQLLKLKRLTKDKDMRLAGSWPKRYQILIATILSAVTRDEMTIEVSEVLFKKYPSFKKLGEARVDDVEKIIRRVNFYKTKAKNIVATSKMLTDKKIPEKVSELIKLPGVGRKVANVYLNEAFGADAIGVDTHVARISFKLDWTKNKNPHKIEKDLEKLFPKKYWSIINDTLVRFGRSYGRSRRREDEILSEL
jgi:endonuclease III